VISPTLYKLAQIKAAARGFGQYLGKVWSHLHYYRYEPRKPSKVQFLKLTLAEQETWIEANIPDYEGNLCGENHLGISYNLDADTVEEHLQYREEYDVSGLIASQISDISEARADEIDAGADLTDNELLALGEAIAENDFDGWNTFSGFRFKVRFGSLYALYVGQDIGQGGVSFEIECVLQSEDAARVLLSDKPMAVLEP
jgi:hypothetical protein